MLRCALEDFLQRSGKPHSPAPAVLHTPHGAPYVPLPNIYLSAAHTAELVIAAIGRSPFGIDAERCDRPLRQSERILRRFFTEQEQAYVRAGSETDTARRFLSLWTKKEAYLKYTGRGLPALSAADTLALAGCFHALCRGRYLITLYTEQPLTGLQERTDFLPKGFRFK